MDAAFNIHHLCHDHNVERFGVSGDPRGMPGMAVLVKKESPVT